MLFTIGDTSSLGMNRSLTEGGSGRLVLLLCIVFTIVQLYAPNLALLNQLFVLDAEFKDFVVITTSEESSFVFKNHETPRLTVMMSDIHDLSASTVNIDSLNSTVVMTNSDLAIQDVKSRSLIVLLKVDLSDKFVCTISGCENRAHVIFAYGYKSSLVASNLSAFASVCFDNKLKFLFLIPKMDTTIGSTGIADSILIKGCRVKLSLLELCTEGTVSEQLFARVSWVPELKRSRSDRNKFEISRLLGPLNLINRIRSSRELHEHLLSVDIVDVHDVVIALVNSGNILLARTDGESRTTLSFGSQTEVSKRFHGICIPNMDRGHLAAFSGCNDVPSLTSSNIDASNVILMEWPVFLVLISILFFLYASKELLLASLKVLNDSECGTRENDLVVVFSEMEHVLVSITSEPMDVINLIKAVWLLIVSFLLVFRPNFGNLFQEVLNWFLFYGTSWLI